MSLFLLKIKCLCFDFSTIFEDGTTFYFAPMRVCIEYDCTFIESLFMYSPNLTNSNLISTSPVMTNYSTVG